MDVSDDVNSVWWFISVVPAAILRQPFYYDADVNAVTYGAVGMEMAVAMVKALDLNGEKTMCPEYDSVLIKKTTTMLFTKLTPWREWWF